MDTRSALGGMTAALRALLATLTEIAQVRLDLLGTELEIQKRRLFDAVLLTALALVLLSVGLVALCAAAILLLWDIYHLSLLLGAAAVFLGLGVLALLYARHFVRSSQGLFPASVAELQQDRAGLQDQDSHA